MVACLLAVAALPTAARSCVGMVSSMKASSSPGRRLSHHLGSSISRGHPMPLTKGSPLRAPVSVSVKLSYFGGKASRLSSLARRSPWMCAAAAAADTPESNSEKLSDEETEAPKKIKKPKALPPAPTCIIPPNLPEDMAIWQNAMVLIDKPQEWTSFDLCGKLRGALKIKKVGHAGTLDPMATGLVIVCIGKGTKHVDSFMAQEKEYTGTIRLGEATASYDAESDITERQPWEHITDEELMGVRDGLMGDIQQIPPMYSAIKMKGKKLYELARKGVEVERPPRAVTVSKFDLERDPEDRQSLHFRVICSKGTYIRSLAHDLGKGAGTAAHLTALRREQIGSFSVADAWGIVDLADRCNEQRRLAAQQQEIKHEPEQQQQEETAP